MSENEEKAIEILKNTRQSWCRILSRYIDKQQKEIEKMREELQMYVDVQNNDIHNYISKDKIRVLKEQVEIEQLSNPYDFSYMLNKLLEEN